IAKEPVVSINDSPQSLAQLPDGGACPGPEMAPPPPPFGPGPGSIFNLGMAGPPGPPGPPFPMGMQGPPIAAAPPDVELTDEQIEKLSLLKGDFMDKFAPVQIKLHSLERDFRIALSQPEIDTSKVSTIRTQIKQQKEIADSLFTESQISAALVFTPEQRRK